MKKAKKFSMTQDKDKTFRPVNQILGSQPSLGPIPADQVLPWTLIALAAYFIINGIFGGFFQTTFKMVVDGINYCLGNGDLVDINRW
jgi:hypothetical protein